MKIKVFPLLILFSISLISCNKEPDTSPSEDYVEAFEAYEKQKADGRIKYLQLCGLIKFDTDETQLGLGSASDNAFNLPIEGLPEEIGKFRLRVETYYFDPADGIEITNLTDSLDTDNPRMKLDENGNSAQLSYDRLKWQIITRSGSQYLRVWDEKNPMVERFKGYEIYPLNTDYILDGQFTYFESERAEEVESQLGVEATTNFIGQVAFSYYGREYTLDVGRNGFTMVRDQTTGDETYGGGRYVYLDLPESDGPVTIDFNRLYNPPCSFSQFTTCLYPPAQNGLDFKLEAGEKLKRKI